MPEKVKVSKSEIMEKLKNVNIHPELLSIIESNLPGSMQVKGCAAGYTFCKPGTEHK